jgi:hypothetical protein
MEPLMTARERETELYGSTPLGRWILDNSSLKSVSRTVALVLAHEYECINETGDYTAVLTQARPELAEFAGCHIVSIARVNKALVKAGEWEVVPGLGATLTKYRPSKRVINDILASKKGE